jgi:hypothetical protein
VTTGQFVVASLGERSSLLVLFLSSRRLLRVLSSLLCALPCVLRAPLSFLCFRRAKTRAREWGAKDAEENAELDPEGAEEAPRGEEERERERFSRLRRQRGARARRTHESNFCGFDVGPADIRFQASTSGESAPPNFVSE